MLRQLYEFLSQSAPAVAPTSRKVPASTFSRWANLPSDRRSIAAYRGWFVSTEHLLHTIRFVSLEKLDGELSQPYKALPENTHHLYLISRHRHREASKPVIVVSMQFGFKAGERKGQYWKTPNWIAQTLLKRLIVEIETAPDCDQSMLQVVSYSRHERRT